MIFWLVVSIIFECIGDFFTKRWSITPSISLLVFSFIGYNLMLGAWFMSMRFSSSIIITGTLWLLMGELVLCIIGLELFKETLNTPQLIGCILSAISLVLLTWKV